MYRNLICILITISFIIILCILLQPSKQQDALSLLSSDKSNELFETQKPRGIRYVLQYVTAILSIIWLILCVVLMYMANR
ncbi:preprotein translocase subunit SecG [Enterococcus lactis]|uniref:preprotein translocase subunit SecG n=1 Tax=Enterococcus lactis TaxID=357441 RepID=UPI0034E984DB